MASDGEKAKPDSAPKGEPAAKVKSPAADAAAKTDTKADAKSEAKTETKADHSSDKGAAPANYRRGEGQKPVTAAYKENWNAIFGKKIKKKNTTKKKR